MKYTICSKMRTVSRSYDILERIMNRNLNIVSFGTPKTIYIAETLYLCKL